MTCYSILKLIKLVIKLVKDVVPVTTLWQFLVDQP